MSIQPKFRISLIYSFFIERPFNQNLGSPLIYFFHLQTIIRQKYKIFFHLLFLFARPFDQKLGSSLVQYFYLHTTIPPELGVILTL